MQYNKDEFRYFYDNYIGIKDRIEEAKDKINELLQDNKLKETLEFYNSLDKEKQVIFNKINCNNDYVRYKLNQKKIEELEKGLNKLYKDFIKSDAFPFSKDEFHFFVSNDTYLVDAINGEDSSELSDEENAFICDSINSVYGYDSNNYNKDDIPLIKVLYLEIKNGYSDHITLCSAIKTDIRLIKNLDKKGKNVCSYRNHQYKDIWKIKHFKNKLLTQEQRVLNSDSKYKDLLLFSIRSAFYELELLSGKRVTDVLKHLESMVVVNQHQERKKEYEIEALIKAYYNLTDIDFRANSMYFSDDDYIFAKFETADFEINKRLLKMMKR